MQCSARCRNGVKPGRQTLDSPLCGASHGMVAEAENWKCMIINVEEEGDKGRRSSGFRALPSELRRKGVIGCCRAGSCLTL